MNIFATLNHKRPVFEQPTEGGEAPPPEGGETPPEGGNTELTNERPDWLLEKFETVEDQAKSHSEMFKQFSKKTDDIKADIMADLPNEYRKTVGVPEDPSEYAYPETLEAPSESVDKALRDWANKNNVSKDGFTELLEGVYGQTVADARKEFEQLGEHGEQRIETVNKWVSKNIDLQHNAAVSRMMQTADGVAFMETIMEMNGDSGFAPTDGGDTGARELTRESIREAQADPRFQTDVAYQQKVREMWAAFAAKSK